MRERISQWMENMCDLDYVSKWDKPLEWFTMGFMVAIALVGILL